MSIPFKPYGQIADGSLSMPVDATGIPIVSAIEILASLPSVGHADNYKGRCVFSVADGNVYLFTLTPTNAWISMKNAAATVAAPAPSSPGSTGDLYYSTDTEILYIYMGTMWVAIGGKMGSGVIWRHYIGDGVTSQYPTGSNQGPPVEYVQVFVAENSLSPGTAGVRDYYMVGNDVALNATPSNGTKISVRTLVHQNFTRTSNFIVRRHVTDGTANSFDVGTSLMQPGQTSVFLQGVHQIPFSGGVAGTYDYRFVQQDITCTLTAVGTTVTLTSTVPHGFIVSDPIKVRGANQSQYNGTWTVASVPTSTTLTYVASSAPSVSPATGTITYLPAKQNDTIQFYNASGTLEAPPTGLVLYIQSISNVLAAS